MEECAPDPQALLELLQTHMPFGKYKGRLLIDLGDWGRAMQPPPARSVLSPLGLYWGHVLQRFPLISHHFRGFHGQGRSCLSSWQRGEKMVGTARFELATP